MTTGFPKNLPSLIFFVVLVVGGGSAIGIVTAPGLWYAALHKPPFNPPGWVFAPVWTILYVFIAVAGWRIWRHARRSWAMRAWAAQLVFNFVWSPLFFSVHRIDLAFADILCLWLAIGLFIVASWSRDRAASLLFVAYMLWVSFAGLLNASLLLLNP